MGQASGSILDGAALRLMLVDIDATQRRQITHLLRRAELEIHLLLVVSLVQSPSRVTSVIERAW